jgi:putative ABC transport system ATP-binding protein
MKSMIKLSNVNKTYKSSAGDVKALVNVNLELDDSESAFVIGRSGSGKSTLLNILSGIDRVDTGEVVINGTSLRSLSENDLALWRGKNIGVVFQNYQLISTLSAIDNVLFPMDLVGAISKSDRRKRATMLLENVGLGDKIKKFPNELSGGEGQRVAIARALANDPQIIVADEPTGNLDTKTGDQIYELFGRLKSAGKNLIIVTHEHLREKNFDRVLTMEDGVLSTIQVAI